MSELTPEEKEQPQEIFEPQIEETTEQPHFIIYASFWSRFVANFIDGLFLSVFSVILGIILLMIPGISIQVTKIGGFFPKPPTLLLVLLYWFYYAVMESSPYQGTLGKLIIGLAVTDMNGNRVSFFRASNRFFAKTLSALIFYIGFIIAGFTQKKQALHDIISRCLVVKKAI